VIRTLVSEMAAWLEQTEDPWQQHLFELLGK